MTAKELGERMVKIETDITYIKKAQEEMKQTQLNNHLELSKKMDDFIESADNKYARKEIEKFMYWVGGTILATVLAIGITWILRGGFFK